MEIVPYWDVFFQNETNGFEFYIDQMLCVDGILTNYLFDGGYYPATGLETTETTKKNHTKCAKDALHFQGKFLCVYCEKFPLCFLWLQQKDVAILIQNANRS